MEIFNFNNLTFNCYNKGQLVSKEPVDNNLTLQLKIQNCVNVYDEIRVVDNDDIVFLNIFEKRLVYPLDKISPNNIWDDKESRFKTIPIRVSVSINHTVANRITNDFANPGKRRLDAPRILWYGDLLPTSSMMDKINKSKLYTHPYTHTHDPFTYVFYNERIPTDTNKAVIQLLKTAERNRVSYFSGNLSRDVIAGLLMANVNLILPVERKDSKGSERTSGWVLMNIPRLSLF